MVKPLVMTRGGVTIGPVGRGNQVDEVADPFTVEITNTGLLVLAEKRAFFRATTHWTCEFRFDSSRLERVDAGRSAGKAAVGAIAGTLLAGPLGLIAGAALGGRKTYVVLATSTISGSTLLVEVNGSEYQELIGRGLRPSGD